MTQPFNPGLYNQAKMRLVSLGASPIGNGDPSATIPYIPYPMSNLNSTSISALLIGMWGKTVQPAAGSYAPSLFLQGMQRPATALSGLERLSVALNTATVFQAGSPENTIAHASGSISHCPSYAFKIVSNTITPGYTPNWSAIDLCLPSNRAAYSYSGLSGSALCTRVRWPQYAFASSPIAQEAQPPVLYYQVGKDSQYGKAYEWFQSMGWEAPLAGKIARDSTTVRLALEDMVWTPGVMTQSDDYDAAVYTLDAVISGPAKWGNSVIGATEASPLQPFRFQRLGACLVVPGGWHRIGPLANSGSAVAANTALPLRLRDTALGTFEYAGPLVQIPDNTCALALRAWCVNVAFGPDIVLRVETSNSQLFWSGGGYPIQPE